MPADPRPPLAERARPASLEEVVGQERLIGEGGPLRAAFASGEIPSLILWGPPGSGKTTLARILGRQAGYAFEEFSAVLAGVAEVRAVVQRAADRRRLGQRTLLFVDEIHRFNKAQQDAFLPHIESGAITLIGATTENPSFELRGALLSRCLVHVLEPLDETSLRRIGERAYRLQAGSAAPDWSDGAWTAALRWAGGDARKLLNLIERVVEDRGADAGAVVAAREVETVAQRPLLPRRGDEDHFDWISALHKSLRGSDPHAAVYWLSRMLEAGEDPLYVARRLVRFASEDVGLADPGALALAVAAKDAFQFLGSPEGHLALAEAAIYLALAPKSNTVYRAHDAAVELVRSRPALPVPLRLRQAPTPLLRQLEYGAGYRYPHDDPRGWVAESYLPDAVAGRILYRPGKQGREPRMEADHAGRTDGFYREPPTRPPGESDGGA